MTSSDLKIINPFSNNFVVEVSQTIPSGNIDNYIDAVKYLACENQKCLNDSVNNKLQSHIDSYLKKDANFRCWEKNIMNNTPVIIKRYQNNPKKMTNTDFIELNNYIVENGFYLPEGQNLIHGGIWKGNIPNRPLSTSFDPLICLNLAFRNKNCQENKRIDFFLLTVKCSNVKGYLMKTKKVKHCNEKELLLEANLNLELKMQVPLGEIEQSHYKLYLNLIDVMKKNYIGY